MGDNAISAHHGSARSLRLLMCLELSGRDALKRAFADPVLLRDGRVLQNLLTTEDYCLPNAKYFEFQPESKPFMRRILTSWMLEVDLDRSALSPLPVSLSLSAVSY